MTAIVPSIVFHIATVLGVLLALLLLSRILRDQRVPAATMGWLLIIVLLPFVGIPLYLLFGERKIKSLLDKKGKIDFVDTPDRYHHPLNSLLVSLGIPSCSSGHQVSFHQDGHVAWDALKRLLKEAQHSLDIAIFILGQDRVGHEVLQILEQKATQGVRVRLLLDGVGSFALPKKSLRPLVAAGGQIAWFIPVVHRPLRGKTNLRNHRKIIIADGHIVWSGGRNLANDYIGTHCPDDCWIDLSFTQQGPSVATYTAIFEEDWHFATGLARESSSISTIDPTPQGGRVQVVPSGPDVADDPIYAAILTACYEAHQRIMIVTPYYVPDSGVQEALRLAALRGVQVDLLLPEQSNHHLADIARRRYLRELTASGVQVWLLPHKMIHAKCLLIDNSFAMAGSANLDIRSLFLNCEVMSCFYSEQEVLWLADWMNKLLEQAYRHTPAPPGLIGETLEGMVLLAAYQL